MNRVTVKEGLHPRNRYRNGYDFAKLSAAFPALAPFVTKNAHGNESVDYADPRAVKALNQALLLRGSGLESWDIPPGSLCPPIPGRSDYIHHLADLLSGGDRTAVPRGKAVRILDIGTGASCIYPLIGASEYGWRFVGTEIDLASHAWASQLVAANPSVTPLIDCRLQTAPAQCFSGVVQPGEIFDAVMCNPPFHASAAEAAAGTRRKVRNLSGRKAEPVLNFGGKDGELWCPGGELGFIRRMISQSTKLATECLWFTSLVSRSEHLPRFQQFLRDVRASGIRTIGMSQGNKQSRILAWSFLSPAEHLEWRRRWTSPSGR